jgi:hypothetical protein
MSLNCLTLRILSKLVRKPKSMKRNLKCINRHHGAHLKTLYSNTFTLTKVHHHHIQDKIRINVLNVTHLIRNLAISARTKKKFIVK